ncbi:UDP-glucose 4-epimerase GalE [Pseudomonas sp. MWU16_30317]|uniref:UDP-glucose 4-epimerase GalE n=1 Tax=Pseudomonas sp. MWU16-30317 TaxID=2878095 RepID=UPI001CFA6262
MQAKVLVVGGAGYIGSHMVRMLCESGVPALVLDDMSAGHSDAVDGAELLIGDMGDSALLDRVFAEYQIDAVMHFASFIQVGESVKHPAKYFDNNIGKTITLLNSMARNNVRQFIFSSTAAIFGDPETSSVNESHPKNPINPYGKSKLIVEELLADYEQAYGLRSVCLRYFNAAGAHPDGTLGERHCPETHLIPLAIQAALGANVALTVYGADYPTQDGTCVRDYIHVCDIAAAHLRALEHLRDGGSSLKLNLGNGAGYSVKEIIDSVGRLSGHLVPHNISSRRTGDPAVLVADSQEARGTLRWTPQFSSLDDIIGHALNYYKLHQ